MVKSISAKEHAQFEQEEYDEYGRPPKGFDFRNPKYIQVFSKRLREIRKSRNADSRKLNKESGQNLYPIIREKDLAGELGLSTMSISNYENGNIKGVPMNRLREICAYYRVTPHYLLGYVTSEKDSLRLDKDGNIVLDANGNPQIMHSAMEFTPASCVAALEIYENLYMENTDLFWIIYKIISANEEKRSKYRDLLTAILALN